MRVARETATVTLQPDSVAGLTHHGSEALDSTTNVRRGQHNNALVGQEARTIGADTTDSVLLETHLQTERIPSGQNRSPGGVRTQFRTTGTTQGRRKAGHGEVHGEVKPQQPQENTTTPETRQGPRRGEVETHQHVRPRSHGAAGHGGGTQQDPAAGGTPR